MFGVLLLEAVYKGGFRLFPFDRVHYKWLAVWEEDIDMTKKNSESLQNSRKGVYLPLQKSRKGV